MGEIKFTTAEMNKLATAIIKEQGMNAHQIKSFDHFLEVGLKQIMENLFVIKSSVELNNKLNDNVRKINYEIKFSNIRIKRPQNMFFNVGKINLVVPNFVRKNDLNYEGEVGFTIELKLMVFLMNDEPPINIHKKLENRSFNLPIMVKSKGCNLREMSNDELKRVGEDAMDIGGYFIVHGHEWIVTLLESKKFNHPHCFITRGHENELARLEIINKPGDAYEHSSELIIKLKDNFNITLQLTSSALMKTVPIPFYIIFQLFGIINDSTIIQYITSFTNDQVLKDKIQYILETCMLLNIPPFNKTKGIIECDILLKTVSECMANPTGIKNPDIKIIKLEKIFNQALMEMLDVHMFPNIGKTPDCRLKKLYYLGYLVFHLLCVHLHIIPPTDRDAYTKRLLTPGVSFAKMLKSIFNLEVTQKINKKIRDELMKTSYLNLITLETLLKFTLRSPKLEKTINKAITTGTKVLKISSGVIAANRLQSELLNRKNNTNTIAAQRTIRTASVGASKQDARADEMRRVHPTGDGYIDPIQSADTGESVGIVKQLAISAIISLSQNSQTFINFLLSDKDVINFNSVDPLKIQSQNLCKIFVNGGIIGVTQIPFQLITRLREYRRGFDWDPDKKVFTQTKILKVHPETTFFWDFFFNNIHVWLDPGRLLKPFCIVRNNTDLDVVGQEFYFKNKKYNYELNTGFMQKLCLTREHFHLSLSELQRNGVIEYISPDEMDNMYICVDVVTLYTNEMNPLFQYTHCDWPSANCSIPTLICPFPTGNQAPRLTFQTNQAKQTIGIPVLNRSEIFAKHLFQSTRQEYPLVQTIANELTWANGLSEIVAIASYGWNQEDSLVVNKTSMNRCLFQCSEHNYMKITLEQDEYWGKIDQSKDQQLSNANYSKLGANFHVPKFALIRYNDVLIAKYKKIKDNFQNTSEIWKGNEVIYIEDIYFNKTHDNYEFCKLKYYSWKICTVGDKFSTRHGQKGSVSLSLNHTLLPFTKDGIMPDKILNPYALPSRMTIGQIIEGVCAKDLAEKGEYMDGTMFEMVHLDVIRERLESRGRSGWGSEHMYDGVTGQWINNPIFITPITYQKLPKFAKNEIQATNSGPISLITRQPLDGKVNNGGLKYGEMEKDVGLSSGGVHFVMEKMRDDSDGFSIFVCSNCKKMATAVNKEKQIYKCNYCKPKTPNIVEIPTTWVSKNLFQHLESSFIGVKIYPEVQVI
jgi:DNA-directed RNA polymerase II subunit RPB2